MMDDFLSVCMCAACVHACHDFPKDSWHELKHDAGWHTCKLDGVFRYANPQCRFFEIDEDSFKVVA